MHGFWSRFGTLAGLQPFYEGTEVGSGAAVADPVYEVPAGVGTGDGTSRPDGQPSGPASTTPNPGSGREPAAGASRDGAAARTSDPTVSAAGTSTTLPAGRSEEIARREAARVTQLEATLKSQSEIIEKLKGVFAPAAATDPKAEAVRNRLFEVMPELKALIGLDPKQIQSALEAIPAFQRNTDQQWNTLAERTMGQIYTSVLPYVMGPDGKVDQLTEDQRGELANSFRSWCLRDKTGARVDRYERGDAKLVEEFRDYYAGVHHAPAHRATVAAAAARAQAGGAAPRAGRADATGTPIPKVDATDEDAVHNAAWKHVSNALRGA